MSRFLLAVMCFGLLVFFTLEKVVEGIESDQRWKIVLGAVSMIIWIFALYLNYRTFIKGKQPYWKWRR